MSVRLLYVVSHPIQYQEPLLRLISADSEFRLRVIFERDPQQSGGAFDPGFGRDVVWDLAMRYGYDSALMDDVDIAQEIRNADVVWCHGWGSARLRRMITRAHGLGRPVLMRGENNLVSMPDRSGPIGWVKRLYLRWIFRQCWGFLAIGSANTAYYRAHGVAPERIFSMPYAVDNHFFASRASQADTKALRDSLGIAPERQVVLYSGKFITRKNPLVLLRAWRQARWSGLAPVLLFVGTGEMEMALRAEAGEEVVFAGFRNQTELPAFYALADVFVLASHAEPWGLAVNEAMAAGTAVIVSDQCGCAFDIVDEHCGQIVPAGDIAALARALVTVCDHSAEMGRMAATKIAHWDFSRDVDGLRQAVAAMGINR